MTGLPHWWSGVLPGSATVVPAAAPVSVAAQPDDELMVALLPSALDLITAVHQLDAAGVTAALDQAALLSGDQLAAARHLAILCAAMCSEDHAPVASLGWTLDPTAYHDNRSSMDALTASLRAGRTTRRA